jgi:hypothetical protein
MIKLVIRLFFDVICVGYNMGSHAYVVGMFHHHAC